MELTEIVYFLTHIGDYLSRGITEYNAMGRQVLDFLHIIFDNMFQFFLVIAVFVSALYYLAAFHSLFGRKKPRKYEFDEKKAPFVSVQIPTYNELVAIKCAENCMEFDYPKDRYEIIIGDDSTDREISGKLDEFANTSSLVKVVRRGSNQGYKAGNLNNMLNHSKGEILVIFDSDFTPESDFLRRIAAPFISNPDISAVQARWKFRNQNQNMISTLGSTIGACFHQITLPFISRKKEFSFIGGSAEAVRKSDLVRLGGWQNGSLTEDIEFSLRLMKNGHKIEYLEDLECQSEVPFVPKDLYRQQMRWAYGVISAYKEHWRDIVMSRKLGIGDKINLVFVASGYCMAILLLFLFSTGFLSFITHPPGPIDLGKFFSELGRNIILTSGLLFASVVALVKNRNSRGIPSMMASSFSYGLIVTYYVNMGIFKVMLNRPMRWYMLNKKGNLEAIQSS
ncbi:glycosyltransferase [Candidatus Woesearchaeota archaeon]|nr:glycosyltransferase [Candidatus Woesearchaeota archaeon]